MALNKVSQAVQDAAFSRISDPVTGINPGIATNCALYSLPNFLTIDFSATSNNFFQCQIEPELFETSGIIKYPCAALYTLESAETNTQKFNQFSGTIRSILEINLSWAQIKGLQNFERYCNCLEDVVFDVYNRVANQNWPNPLVYNGQIQCKRGPARFGGNNFKQKIGFAAIFEVHR